MVCYQIQESNEPHHILAGRTEVAFDARDLHGIYQHASQSEWDLLGVLVSLHGHLQQGIE